MCVGGKANAVTHRDGGIKILCVRYKKCVRARRERKAHLILLSRFTFTLNVFSRKKYTSDDANIRLHWYNWSLFAVVE